MKTRKIKLIKPHEGQAKIIREFMMDPSKKFGVVSVGRQLFGKSLLAMNAMIGWMMSKPNLKGGWITPLSKHWMKALKDINDAAHPIIKTVNKMEGTILFVNNSELKFLSTENEDGVRGFTFDYAVVDEAGFVKTSAFNVLAPTWGVKGKKVLMISTPGIKNWFYDYFTNGFDDNYPNIISFHGSSYDNPFFPNDEIDAMRQIMDEDQFKQEYLAEFSDSAGGVFVGFDGQCYIEDYVVESNDECYFGVDIARGGKDKTSITIMGKDGHILNREYWREGDTQTQIDKLASIIKKYPNCKRGMIETNQEVGIFQSLRRMFADKDVIIQEFYTTRKNKPPLIQNLAADIQNQVIGLPTKNLDPILYDELSDFTYVKKEDGYIKYGHSEGKHDDSVISTALANEARLPVRHTRRSFIDDLRAFNLKDMNYVGRKDGGSYIASKQAVEAVDKIYLTPIAYSKDIVDFAAEQKIGYRDAFIVVTHKDDIDDPTEFIKRAKTRRNGGES